MVMKSYKNFSEILLGMAIFYQIFITSYWQTVYTSHIWQGIGYFIYLILSFIMLFFFYKRKFKLNQLLYFFICIMITIVFLVKGDSYIVTLFLIGSYVLILNVEEVLKVYFVSVLTAFSIVAMLSLAKVFPLTTADGILVFGFRNQNTAGFYIALVFIIYLTLRWQLRNTVTIILGLVLSFFLIKALNDFTAASIILVDILFYVLDKSFHAIYKWTLVRWLIVASPILLTAITFWIGFNYTRYSILSTLNVIFTSRPMIWNYYLTQYPLSFFGTNIGEVTFNTIGNGAFDGAYAYYALVHGMFVFCIIIIILTKSLITVSKSNNVKMISLMMTLIVAAFSENIPFTGFQSPLLPIAILISVMDNRILRFK